MYNDKYIVFSLVLGFVIGSLFVFLLLIGTNSHKDRTMVSYEYTTQCRCGGTIEGYQSLVDDYNREECKNCGYHKE